MRDDILTSAMDNVLASMLADAFQAAAAMPVGDSIDRGLGLRRALEDAGFGLVVLDPNNRLFIGQRPLARQS